MRTNQNVKTNNVNYHSFSIIIAYLLLEKSDNKHEQIRFLLLLYCHIFEMDELYNIIGNMLRISLGERYEVMLYSSPSLTTELKPANKLNKLKSLAKKKLVLNCYLTQ